MNDENVGGIKSKLDKANREIRALKDDVTRIKKLNSELAFENVKYRHMNLKLRGLWKEDEPVEKSEFVLGEE